VNRTVLFVFLLLAGALPRASAQSLLLAPADTEDDRIRRLTSPPTARPLEIEFRAFACGDTNVLPLVKGGERHAPRRSFQGDYAYFTDYRNSEMALSKGMWRLSYASTNADLYEGNHDAAQLYLDSLSNSIDPHAAMRPLATMNRTAAIRWRMGYATPVRWAAKRGGIYLAVSYLRMQRVQLGELTGDTVGNRFDGELTFLSTLDLPPEETRSAGIALDAALELELTPRWRISLAAENLASRIRQRGLQKITAEVATNAIEPDSNGFLHGVPLAQGQISRRNLETGARRRFDIGAACREGARDWMLFVRSDRAWSAALGLAVRHGRDDRWWGLAWLSPFEWQTGLDWGQWRLQFGMSSLDPADARRATLSLSWRLALDRTR
jgi:hypothetical protein